MNIKLLFVIVSIVHFWMPCYSIGEDRSVISDGLFLFQQSFFGSITLNVNNEYILEVCPDNTCDVFISKKSVPVDSLIDFSFTYMYVFSDYLTLKGWRNRADVKDYYTGILKKHAGDKCSNKADMVMSQCLLRKWAKHNGIRLYFVRYDEGGRYMIARSIIDATKLYKF